LPRHTVDSNGTITYLLEALSSATLGPMTPNAECRVRSKRSEWELSRSTLEDLTILSAYIVGVQQATLLTLSILVRQVYSCPSSVWADGKIRYWYGSIACCTYRTRYDKARGEWC